MTQGKKKSRRSKARTAKKSGASSYFFEDVMALAENLANRRKDWGAEKISEFAGSAREFATSVEAIPNLDNFVNPAVESLEEFADYVRETEFEQIVRDSANFARRHPIFAVGGGVLAGLIATQILRYRGTGHKAGARATNPIKQSAAGKKLRKTIASKLYKSNGHAHLNI
jgi:hypothetical protein